MFGRKDKSSEYNVAVADLEQGVLLHLLMGFEKGAADLLMSAMHSDTHPTHMLCRRALDLYKRERFDGARYALHRAMQAKPLSKAIYDKYAIALTTLGILTLSGDGYSLASPDTSTLDKHMALSIHHLRAGRVAEAREEALKAESAREQRTRHGMLRMRASAVTAAPPNSTW